MATTDIPWVSANEPASRWVVQRMFSAIDQLLRELESLPAVSGHRIRLWNANLTYAKDDVVVYVQERSDSDPLVFILVSGKDSNSSIPNWELKDGLPDFSKSNWRVVNPTSYLLQDLNQMKQVVKDSLDQILAEHVRTDHNLQSGSSLAYNLLRKDYSNLVGPLKVGGLSIQSHADPLTSETTQATARESNGTQEVLVRWQLDGKANQNLVLDDPRHYWQKSPIWDESDATILCQKYLEEDADMLAATVNENTWTNLRLGTNVFHARIDFDHPFLTDSYCVFFDTYDRGQFCFGYSVGDIESKTEPTYDAVVSRPMLLNKTTSGFDVVVPIHTHFNSLQQYRIGVPWTNSFRLQAIGRWA